MFQPTSYLLCFNPHEGEKLNYPSEKVKKNEHMYSVFF